MAGMLGDIARYSRFFLDFNLRKKTKAPMSIYLETTRKCNLKCRICDIHLQQDKAENELTLDEIKNLIQESAKLGTMYYTLCGGEPLLRNDLHKIVKELHDNKLAFSLTTNATLLTVDKIKHLNQAGLRNITISLDSSREDIHDYIRGKKGTYNQAIVAIKNLRTHAPKIHISINSVLCRKNLEYADEMVKLSSNLGVSALNFLPIHANYPQDIIHSQDKGLFFTRQDASKLKNKILQIIPLLKKHNLNSMSPYFMLHSLQERPSFRCAAGSIFCEISATGEVFPCYVQKKPIGNLRNKTLKEIWSSTKAKKFRKHASRCESCWQNCYIEPSLRFSPKYQLKHFPKTFKEYLFYFHSGK